MAQRSLLLSAMAIAAAVGAAAMAVVVAGAAGTPAPAAVTVTAPPTVAGTGAQTGQGHDAAVTVPSLTGMRLDAATAALADASLDRRIDGGGLFGVLDDAGWTVCATTPDAGTELAPGDVVVVHVDRSC